jgi:ribosomal-protein-alanine N-acetyltransferase
MRLPRLITNRCSLRLAEPQDLPEVMRYWREHGSRYSPALPSDLLTKEYWEARILLALRELKDGTACKLYVFERERSHIAGTITFFEITRGLQHQCWLGYGLSGEHEGRGLMTEAAERAIEYMFDELKLHRIQASYRPSNTRSERVLARLGFEREGVLRDVIRIDGAWQSQILTTRLNPFVREAAG